MRLSPGELELLLPTLLLPTFVFQSDKYVRAIANVVMLCQTYATGDVKKKKYTRDNIACKLTYMAQGKQNQNFQIHLLVLRQLHSTVGYGYRIIIKNNLRPNYEKMKLS